MVFFIGLLLALQTVQAEIVIEVTQGKQSAIPIAVVPFSLEAGESLPEDLTKIIHNDLGQSGYFRTMPTENMISQPNMPSQVNYDDWSYCVKITLLSEILQSTLRDTPLSFMFLMCI